MRVIPRPDGSCPSCGASIIRQPKASRAAKSDNVEPSYFPKSRSAPAIPPPPRPPATERPRSVKSRVHSRKFGVIDLLETGWQLFAAHFKDILIITLLINIPLNIVSALIDYYLPAKDWISGYRLYLILQEPIVVIATVGIAVLVENALAGRSIGWKEALRHSISKWPAVIETGIVGGLIVSLWSLLLIIPGLIYSVYYSFWVYAAALRDFRATAALDYSKHLVTGRWWRILWLKLATTGVVVLAALLVTMPIYFLTTNPFITFIADMIGSLLASYLAVVATLLFLNMDYLYRPAVSAS